MGVLRLLQAIIFPSALLCLYPTLGNATEKASHALSPAQVALLESGPTLKDIAPEVREALLSIAGLADEYANLTRADLIGMANAETGEDKGLCHVTVPETEGLTKEFWYNIKEELISSVKVTRGDGSAVAVSMTKYTLPADEQEIISWPDLVSTEELADGRWLRATVHEADKGEKVYHYNRRVPELSWISYTDEDGSGGGVALRCPGRKSELRLTGGYVIQPGGKRRLVVYYDRGVSRLPTRSALYDAETGKGKVNLWDGNGVMVAECEVNNQPIPEFMIQKANAKLTVEQCDALDLPARDRLIASPAFKVANIGLQKRMDSIASWADRYGRAMPGDLPYLFSRRDSHVTRIESDDVLEVQVTGIDEDRVWTYYYDKGSSALKKVERDTFAIYFDPLDPGRLIGGRGEDPEAGFTWLISFYPGKCAPRIAIATTGETTGLLAEGKVHVWGPEGETLLEKEIKPAKPVGDVVGEIDATLSDQLKVAINWRGPQEARYLLGEY